MFSVVCFFAFATSVLCEKIAIPGVKEDLEKIALDDFIQKMNTYISTVKDEPLCLRSTFEKGLDDSGMYVDTDSPEHFNQTDSLMVTSTDKLVYLFKLPKTPDQCPLTKCIELYEQRPPFYEVRYKGREYVCVGLKYDEKLRKIVHWKAVHYAKDGKEIKRLEAKKESS